MRKPALTILQVLVSDNRHEHTITTQAAHSPPSTHWLSKGLSRRDPRLQIDAKYGFAMGIVVAPSRAFLSMEWMGWSLSGLK